MIIRGEKVSLRPITPSDLPRLVEWSQDPEVKRHLEGDYPLNLEEASIWFRSMLSDRHNKRWAIVAADGHLIGDIELDHITWRSGEAELRICIGEKAYWDQGYGTDAVSTVCRHAFDDMQLQRVYLRVFADNPRAVRCYAKAGFRKEGRLRRPDQSGTLREIFLMRLLQTEYAVQAGRTGKPRKSGHLSA